MREQELWKKVPIYFYYLRFLYKGIIINHNKNRASLH